MSDDQMLFGHLRAILQTDAGRQRFGAAVLGAGMAGLANADALRIAIRRVMPYRAYLTTEYWRERSRRAKEAARHRCQLCNGTRDLNTHHRTYERRGNEDDEDLTVLCGECHGKFHTKPEPDECGNPAACDPEAMKWAGMTEDEQMQEISKLIERRRKEMADQQVARQVMEAGCSTKRRSGTSWLA
jgi:hypothetical protein